MTDYLANPIRGRALLDKFDAAMRGATSPTAAVELRAASNAPRTSQVLDLDDALATVMVGDVQVHRFLMSPGIERITPFAHLEQASALEGVIAALNDQHFDAAVCDENLARSFHHDPGNADNEDIIRAFMEFGVDAYNPVQDCLPGLEQVSISFSQNASVSAC